MKCMTRGGGAFTYVAHDGNHGYHMDSVIGFLDSH